MKKKIINILVVIFTIGVIYEVYNYVKELNTTNNKVLEDIQISDNLKGSKQIAIKQQDVDFTWKDMGTSMDAWPDIDTFEYYGSECTDASGNNITPTTEVIQFNEQTQTATISTSKTIYCTLKFARRSTVLKLMQKTTTSNYLKTAYEGDELLRYVGTQSDVTSNKLNNFICFGTENKDTCLNNKETYMYRIIGITTSNVNANLGLQKDQLKIIKASKAEKNQQWYNSDSTYNDVKWSNSLVKAYLNGEFLGTIIGTVGTHNWSDLITIQNWYMELQYSEYGNWPGEIYNPSTISEGEWNGKIGLMYATDYSNAGIQDTTNWLFIQNGTSENTVEEEWTMTRLGLLIYKYQSAWPIKNGYINASSGSVTSNRAVRPVFYLTNEISMSGGGTESDPFIISDRIIEE